MHRKILNVYLNHDANTNHRFNMRVIEMQELETFPADLDKTMLNLYSGLELPFAVCMSDELDKYKVGKEPSELFKSLRNFYTRSIVRDGEKTYLYQDLSFLLYAEAASAADTCYPGDDSDLLKTLGMLDGALEAYRSAAEQDDYTVSVNYCSDLPDFTNKTALINQSFAQADSENTQSLSRHVVTWLINAIHHPELASQLDVHTTEAADHILQPLLAALDDHQLTIAVRSKLSIVSPGKLDTPRPPQFSFFSSNDIRSGIKPMREIDLEAEEKTLSLR